MRIKDKDDPLAADVTEMYRVSVHNLATTEWIDRFGAAIIQYVDGGPAFVDEYISWFVYHEDPEVRSMGGTLAQLVIGRDDLHDNVRDWFTALLKDTNKSVIRQLRESLIEAIDQKSDDLSIDVIFLLVQWLGSATEKLEGMQEEQE